MRDLASLAAKRALVSLHRFGAATEHGRRRPHATSSQEEAGDESGAQSRDNPIRDQVFPLMVRDGREARLVDLPLPFPDTYLEERAGMIEEAAGIEDGKERKLQ